MTYVEGKVALVTGGANGLGLAIVQKMLENNIKGVAIVDISQAYGDSAVSLLQPTYGDKVIFIRADITVANEFDGAFKKTIDKFKNIDIVVNNAGILNEENWEKSIAINLVSVVRGTYLAINTYFPKYRSSDESVVVNTASILGINASPYFPVYSTTKHGVVGLGKSLGHKENYNTSKTRVLTICPGVVSTGLLELSKHDVQAQRVMSLSRKLASPEYIGTSVVEIINQAPSGSAWVLEDEEPPYEVSFANRRDLRKS